MTEPQPHHDGLTAEELESHNQVPGKVKKPINMLDYAHGMTIGAALAFIIAGCYEASPTYIGLGFTFIIIAILTPILR